MHWIGPVVPARRLWAAWRALPLIQQGVVFLVALYVSLFLFNSLTRITGYAPDTMNYVDVARNIRAGRGVTQSTLGFNQARFPVDGDIPTPITIQPPLYPLAIAGFTALGLSAVGAAVLVSGLAYALLLGVAFLLMARLYGRDAALLGVALLLVYAPLTEFAHQGLTEAPAVLLLLLGFLLLVKEGRRTPWRAWVTLAAGGCFGLAFAARYALAPGLLVGLLALAIGCRRRGERWPVLAFRAGLLAAGFAVPAVPVLARNLMLTHHLLGEADLPVPLTPYVALRAAGYALTGQYLEGRLLMERGQALLLGAMLLGGAVVLARRKQLWTTLGTVLFAGGGIALTLWVAVYFAFVVVLRTRTFFDLDARTMLPAGVVAVMLLAGLAGGVAAGRPTLVGCAAMVLVGAAVWREARLAARPPAPTIEKAIAHSERLAWAAAQTTDRDLIVGVDAYDIPFYLGRPAAVTFLAFPYAENADYGKLMTWLDRHRRQYERVFLVVPTKDLAPADWREQYGPFVADLAAGRTEPYPDIHFVRRLADAQVFEVKTAAP